MIEKIKELETFFRQYGVEGEDAFIALSCFYLRIHNPTNTSKNLKVFRKKGEKILKKFSTDIILFEQLEEYVSNDPRGESLPNVYQYFLSKKFRDNTGKFFTPKEVAEAMSDMLPIEEGSTVFDPTCGGGTFLLSILRRYGTTKLNILANDVDDSLVFLTELLLIINSNNTKTKCEFYNKNLYTEFADLEKHFGKVDYILANPPFSMPIKSLDVNSPLHKIGYRNSDALFIDLCFELLRDGGKLVCLVPHSLVANSEFKKFRLEIEKRWTVKGVFILPEGVFYTTSNTTTRADIIVLSKGKNEKKGSKIVLGNISKVGIPITQRDKEPIENELKELLKLNNIKSVLN
jgi:type I restriction-modification system DNA methylase subunit